MSGIDLLLLAAGSGGGSSGGTTPALDWNDISGETGAVTNKVTASMSGTITVSATISSIGTLRFIKNGAPAPYGGGFALTNGDNLMWEVTNLSGTVKAVGTITVNDDTNVALIDAFNYVVNPPV